MVWKGTKNKDLSCKAGDMFIFHSSNRKEKKKILRERAEGGLMFPASGRVFTGVSSLATSGHLPPAPQRQTNTRRQEMPERKLYHPALWDDPAGRVGGSTAPSAPSAPRAERLEAAQPSPCRHNISNAGIWGEFVSVWGCKP